MYSFNFDYIFNAIYNGLLAIRYAILFWILRINPSDYILDHKNDNYDGLIARGWIANENNTVLAPSKDTIYLGTVDNYTWWDYIKEHLFGINVDKSASLSSSHSANYGINPDDVSFATDQVNNDIWWKNLHFSIQNPVLAFLADVVSVIAFFALIAFMYSMLRWLFMILAPIREKKEKEKQEELNKRNIERENKIIAREESRILELEKSINISATVDKNDEELLIEEDFPAGIKGLPIDDSYIIKKENIKKTNIIDSYKFKNIIDINKDKVLKIKQSDYEPLREDDNNSKYTEKDIISNLKKERESKLQNPEFEEKIKDFQNRWDIVINYMYGEEEALWRIGILEADNLLGDILLDRGYQGLTISDRLKNANFNTIDLAWSVHKLRNRIAHDGSTFVLTNRMAKNSLELYKSIFTEFNILS